MALVRGVLVSLLLCPVALACLQYAFRRTFSRDNSYDTSARNVHLGVYIEVLCPDCRRFFTNQVAPTWSQLKDVMDVEVFPYGNAKDSPASGGGYSFECQHGPAECRGNMMLACAQRHLPADAIVDFAICVMTDDTDPSAAGPRCAAQLGLPFVGVESCMGSYEGEVILHNVGLQTKSLRPTPNYVPWIVVEGIHNDVQQQSAEDNLKGLICAVYKGVPPAPCIT